MSNSIDDRNPASQQTDGDEINLLEYLLVIVKHKKMIFLTCLVTFILTCGITLLMPNIYTSTARILPPQNDKGGLSSMLGSVSNIAALAGLSVGGGSGELYVGMLKSRSIADAIIDKFDLMEIYGQKYRVKTYKILNDAVNFSVGKDDGIITVTAEDEDPKRAAAIANTYIEELKKLNIKLNLNNAGRERLFLEERLAVVQNDLSKAEDALKDFQEKNKAIRIDAQASAIIDAFATLKGELASKEVELGVLRSSQTDQNPQVKALREEITQIREQISQLEQSHDGKTSSADIFLATSEVPELGIQYARLLRDLKVQETLYELVTKQYEMAKISEAKNTSTIQVLDAAMVPDKKSKPRRSIIVLATTFAMGFFALIFAFIREYGQRMDKEDRLLWQQIKENISLKK
ncbi:GumC family protein [Pelobacter seleniigenes]|uniref:GumC family protein n=1 Tax=Pelobacter seleniigenes TaxID=407188 RepID=UPI0004A76DCE|nr:Wzz/FepE/Etk N-terminal domain-containing protein [Pelobacter seleniigenes]